MMRSRGGRIIAMHLGVASLVLASCGSSPSQAPPPPPPPPLTPKAGPITLDVPAWPPAATALRITWRIASKTGDAAVEFSIGATARRFELGRPAPHVYPAEQSVCDRRMSGSEVLAQLAAEGDYAQLVFTDDELRRVAVFRIRASREQLELVRVSLGRRTVLAVVPVPAGVTLDEDIHDRDADVPDFEATYRCGGDDGISP